MRVDVIDKLELLEKLRANWDAVYEADPESQFFLSSLYLFKWLARLTYPSLVLAVKPDGDSTDYVAFLPIWIKTKERKNGEMYNVVHMGGNHFADYTGFICRPEWAEQALPALGEKMRQMNWAQLHLQDLRASEHRTALFMKGFRKKDFQIEEYQREIQDNIDLGVCPYVRLPGDWDAYLDGKLSANTRQKLRRLLRQLETSTDLRITQPTPETIDRDIDILMGFWAKRWGDKKGVRLAGIIENNRKMLRHCFEAGALFLPILWRGDKPGGALAIYIDHKKKTFLFFITGRDASFNNPQPGLVLHAHSIRYAIQNGFAEYDFLRGNEDYKYSFGVDERPIKTIVLNTWDKKNLGGKLDLRCMPVVLKRSTQHLRTGALDKAEIGYRHVLAAEPRKTAALYGLARIAAARGEELEATALHKTLEEVSPDGFEVCFVQGRMLQAQGKIAEAADAYAMGVEREPDDADVYYDLGQILFSIGLYELAIASFEVTADLEADFPDINLTRMKTVKLRDRQSAATRMSLTTSHAAMIARIGKLKSIAKAVARNRPKAEVPLVLEWQQKGPERPFSFSRNAMPTAGAVKTSGQKG